MAEEAARWYDVVYGRTPEVDRWWRVTPAIPDIGPWLSAVVPLVVNGGKGLEYPRYLLAQDANLRLVGVACMAARLSDTMNRETVNPETGRPSGRHLYTFVGWLGEADGSGFPPTPDLAGLVEGAMEWCGPVYEHWAGLTWHESPSQSTTPHHSHAAPARWPVESGAPDRPASRTNPPAPENLQRIPERDLAEIWRAVLPTGRRILITAGWQSARAVPRETPMYAGVNGIDTRIDVRIAPHRSDDDLRSPGESEASRPAANRAETDRLRPVELLRRGKDALGALFSTEHAEEDRKAAPEHGGYEDLPTTAGAISYSEESGRREQRAPGDGPMRRHLSRTTETRRRGGDAGTQPRRADGQDSHEPP